MHHETTQPNPYLRTQVLTANPQQLRLMLYDGAIKFCRQARDAMVRRDYEASYHALVRAQKIVLELSGSLKHDLDPDLCSKLSGLYTYIYRRLVDANMERDPAAIDETLDLIGYERETWLLLMRKLERDGGVAEADPAPPAPNPIATIGPEQAATYSNRPGKPRNANP